MSDSHHEGSGLTAKVFNADSIHAGPDTSSMAQAFALVALNFVVHPVGKSEILHAEAATGPFQEGDYLQIRSLDDRAQPLAVMKAWFKIVGIIEENTINHRNCIWRLEHIQGGRVGAVIGKGNAIVNFGKPTEVTKL
jgi:hypothetical protein